MAKERTRKLYTESENQFIRDNFDFMRPSEIAAALGRDYTSVLCHIKGMGLTPLTHGRGRHTRKWYGCDDDCENCIYPDCYKPYSEFKFEEDNE